MLIKTRVPSLVTGKNSSRLVRIACIATIGCSAVLGSVTAFASPEAIAEVSRLVDQGKMPQAAKQAESFLKQNPSNVQMRFLQGVIAAEQKQNAQAIKIFSALSRDYPNLPEPYNNLAVLYAAEGQERKASEVLEQAIRTNPSYATAHENLGDLYARMASDAYSKALSLDSGRQTVQPKLALITQIFPKTADLSSVKVATAQTPVAAKTVAKPAEVAPPKAPEPKPLPVAAAKPVEPKPAAPEVKVAEVKPVEPKHAPEVKVAEVKPVEPKPAPVKPVPVQAPEVKAALPAAQQIKPAATPVPVESKEAVRAVATKPVSELPKLASADAAKQAVEKTAPVEKKAVDPKALATAEVETAVKAWASAWAGQNLTRYFDAYSQQFAPAGGASLSQWKEQRRQRIAGKAAITVTVRDLKITVNGDKASARFRQNYAAGSLKSTTIKTLQFEREGGHWRITREGTGA